MSLLCITVWCPCVNKDVGEELDSDQHQEVLRPQASRTSVPSSWGDSDVHLRVGLAAVHCHAADNLP